MALDQEAEQHSRVTASVFDLTVDYFDQVQAIDWWSGLLDRFIEFALPREAGAVLDVGCGPGLLSRKLAERCRCVAGVDIAPKMVERASDYARSGGYQNLSFRVGSCESLPYADSSFDAVVATSVVYLSPQPFAALAEMARVVRPGGIVASLDPSLGLSSEACLEYIERQALSGFSALALIGWSEAATGSHRFSAAGLAELFSAAGLGAVQVEPAFSGMCLFGAGRR